MLDIRYLNEHPEIMQARVDALVDGMAAYVFNRTSSIDVQSAASGTKALFMGVFLVAGDDARAFAGGYLAAFTMLTHVAENPMLSRDVAAVYQAAIQIMSGEVAS